MNAPGGMSRRLRVAVEVIRVILCGLFLFSDSVILFVRGRFPLVARSLGKFNNGLQADQTPVVIP